MPYIFVANQPAIVDRRGLQYVNAAIKLTNYNNGAVGNQLTDVGRDGGVCWGGGGKGGRIY